MNNESLLMVCAEESSANYGKRIMDHLLSKHKDLDIYGIGSKGMEKKGLKRIGASEEMSIMGIVEVFRHYKKIRKVFYNILKEVDKKNTKTALLVDYPGFNLRLAKKLKERGIKVIYFISPSVWAWRKGRLKTIQACVDEMLVIYPFEKEFYDKEGVKATYVGNPIKEGWSEDVVSEEKLALQKSKMGYKNSDIVLGLMPGSRNAEIEQHLGVQINVFREMKKKIPNLKANLLLAENFDREVIQMRLPNNLEDFTILQDESFKMLQSVDAVLVASGTATLVVGLMQKPMVVMYRVNPVTAWIVRRLANVDHVSLVNLLFKNEIVPEYIQEKVKVELLTKAMLDVLENDKFLEVKNKLKELPAILGDHSPTREVADVVMKYVK